MSSLGKLLGIRLMVHVGSPLAPAPAELLQAITSVQVTNSGAGQDGFSLTLTLTKRAGEFNLLDVREQAARVLQPPNRIAIGVLMGVMPEVLIDGVITHHQVTPSADPGASTLTVMGRDWTEVMNFTDRNETYRNQPDNVIVQTILERYADYLPVPELQLATRGTPIETQQVSQQASTDLAYIQFLATRNGFAFYVEPQAHVFGVNRAYFGTEERGAVVQPALTLNMGAASNLTSINFSYDALAATAVTGNIIDPTSGALQPISPAPPKLPPLSLPPVVLRTTIRRDVANLGTAEAGAAVRGAVASQPDAVTGSGQLNTLRYGNILRARRRVGVRGVGTSFDGDYYVRSVTHAISRTDYSQSFSLSREGRGALSRMVLP